MADEVEKRPVGRPSEYDPAYCDGVVEFMGQGYSLTAYAGEISHHRETLLEWGKVHPEFSDAVKRGQAARTKCLEEGLLGSDIGPRVTARIFALKNAAPDEWADVQKRELSNPDGSLRQPSAVIVIHDNHRTGAAED